MNAMTNDQALMTKECPSTKSERSNAVIAKASKRFAHWRLTRCLSIVSLDIGH